MSLVRPAPTARRTTREGLDIPDEQSGANPFAVMAFGQRSRATVALVVSGTGGGPAFATFTRDRRPGAWLPEQAGLFGFMLRYCPPTIAQGSPVCYWPIIWGYFSGL